MNNKKLYNYYFLIFNGSLKYSDKSFQIYNKKDDKHLRIRIRARGNVVLKQRFSCKKYREKNNIKCRYSNTIHENKQSICQESTS